MTKYIQIFPLEDGTYDIVPEYFGEIKSEYLKKVRHRGWWGWYITDNKTFLAELQREYRYQIIPPFRKISDGALFCVCGKCPSELLIGKGVYVKTHRKRSL